MVQDCTIVAQEKDAWVACEYKLLSYSMLCADLDRCTHPHISHTDTADALNVGNRGRQVTLMWIIKEWRDSR